MVDDALPAQAAPAMSWPTAPAGGGDWVGPWASRAGQGSGGGTPVQGRPNGGGAPRGGDGGRARIPARAAWWALPGAMVGVVLAGIGAGVGEVVSGSAKSAATDLLSEVGLWVAMFGTAWLVSQRYGSGDLSRDYGLSAKAKDPLWGALAAACALAVAEVVLVAFANTPFAGSNDELLTQQQGHKAGLVVVSLLVAFGAPFFEELFFRGFLRVSLQARFGAHGAVWLQAVFFGLAHFGEATTALGNVSVLLALFSVGVVLGYTAMLTHRLAAGMVAHCLFNLLAVVAVL